MGRFDRQIATARRLIALNGVNVVWRKLVPPVDDNPGLPGQGTLEDHPVKIVFFPNNELSLLTSLSMLAGTEVPSGRIYGLMGAVDFVPALNDLVIGSPYGDLGIRDKDGIDELNPNGQSILFTIRFSR